MNEKILEIAKVVGLKNQDENTLSTIEEKFAKEIIQECIKVCQQQAVIQHDAFLFSLVDYDTSSTAEMCMKQIEKHFNLKNDITHE